MRRAALILLAALLAVALLLATILLAFRPGDDILDSPMPNHHRPRPSLSDRPNDVHRGYTVPARVLSERGHAGVVVYGIRDQNRN